MDHNIKYPATSKDEPICARNERDKQFQRKFQMFFFSLGFRLEVKLETPSAMSNTKGNYYFLAFVEMVSIQDFIH